MASLRTNYKDDILSGDRKYRMITNSDGTVSFQDVTDYTQEGDTFGALDINATNTAVNALQEANGDTDISGIGDGTNTGAIHTLNTHLSGEDVTSLITPTSTITSYNAMKYGKLLVINFTASSATNDGTLFTLPNTLTLRPIYFGNTMFVYSGGSFNNQPGSGVLTTGTNIIKANNVTGDAMTNVFGTGVCLLA